MAEANHEQDELLLMRHLDGRLSPAETAALKARLASEPALAEKLEALDLENDLIAGAVSVPDDVELPEPVMMAIIDQALKDPKRPAAGRGWWKPVTLSLGAAAAVVLAVLSSFLLNSEKTPTLMVEQLQPKLDAVIAKQAEPGAGHAPVATLLSQGAQIVAGCELTSAGGTASLKLHHSIALHFDSDTKIKVDAIEEGQRVAFELQHGAMIVDYYPNVAGAYRAVEVFTADGRLKLTLERGRTLIQPLSGQAVDGRTPYLVYMPEGQGQLTSTAAQPTGAKPAALSDGTQVLWPISGSLPPRLSAGNALVRDLLCGWQFAPAHAAGAWWNGELRYDNLDRAWPLEWAQDIASNALHAPNFLTQAQSLSESAVAEPQAATAEDVFRHWMDMSNTLEDRVLRSQLESGSGPELTWYLLTVKANRRVMQIAAAAPEGRLSPMATEPARERLNAALRWLEDKAGKEPDNLRLQAALAWLRLETDFATQKMERNEAARYQAFIQDFPTSLESLVAQLRRARLEPTGDSRLSQLNLAWQDCRQFAVRMQPKLTKDDQANARQRLVQIQMETLTALAEELFARGKFVDGREVAALPAYLNLPNQLGTAREALGDRLEDLTVQAVAVQGQALIQAGKLDEAEAVLLYRVPAILNLTAPAPRLPVALDPALGTATPTASGLWAQTYLKLLRAQGNDASAKFLASHWQGLVPMPVTEAPTAVDTAAPTAEPEAAPAP